MVYSHDGKPHRVLETFRRAYIGPALHLLGQNGKSLCLTEDHLVLTSRRVRHLTPSGQWSGVPHHHFERARVLRRTMSPPEVAVWCALRGGRTGVKFRRQHPVGPYIADFYCHECGLVVEVDGAQHFETEKAEVHDRARDAFMENMGLTVLRFSAHDVGANLTGVLDSIYQRTRERALETDPEKQWRLAEFLYPGDIVFAGIEFRPIRIVDITVGQNTGELHCIHVEETDSCVTDLCVVRN